MYFAIPVSNKEIIIDTPLDAKSIRSFHFVDRNGGCCNLTDGKVTTVTISIDGQDICRNLFVLPFTTQATLAERIFMSPFDARDVSVMCLKNVNMSEIKISACGNLDFEVVFEYSDVEVETEKVEFFEGFQIDHTNWASEIQLFTEQESERIFIFSGMNMGNKVINNNVPGYDGVGYYAHTAAYDADTNFTISTTEEVFPKGFPITLISTALNVSWKDAQYTFDNLLSKQPRFKFDDRETMTVPSQFFMLIMLSYDKLLK